MASSNRKISVIMIADAVGYSKHMEVNEDATLASYKECEAILKDLLKKHDGSIFNTAGDSVLTEFSSAVNAVECGVEFQRAIKEKNSKQDNQVNIEFRVGINMGDVVETDGNLLGDGVNIAARLEALSMPGGVSISKSVHDMIVGKTELTFKNQGLQKVKQNEFYVYDVVIDPTQTRTLKTKGSTTKKNVFYLSAIGASVLALGIVFFQNLFQVDQNYNTLLVSPFDTLSQDQDQKNFAFGLSQDLGNGITRYAKGLKVVTLSKIPENISQAVKEAEAKFLLSGNIRKSGDKLRVVVNLIDSQTMATLWTKNFDRNLSINETFTVQDEIVGHVVDELVGNGAVLSKNISKNSINLGARNLSSYQCVNYFRGEYKSTFSSEVHQKSIDCLKDTVKNDPDYTDAWIYLADAYYWGYHLHGNVSKEDLKDALEFTNKAIASDSEYGLAYAMKGRILFHLREWTQMFEAAEQAIKLSPLHAETLAEVAHFYMLGGECTIDNFKDPELTNTKYIDGKCRFHKGYELALAANELDKANFIDGDNWALGVAYLGFEDGARLLKAMEEMPTLAGFFWWELEVGIAHHWLGNFEEAKRYLDNTKKLLGGDNLELWKAHFDFWNASKQNWVVVEPILKKYGWK